MASATSWASLQLLQWAAGLSSSDEAAIQTDIFQLAGESKTPEVCMKMHYSAFHWTIPCSPCLTGSANSSRSIGQCLQRNY